MGIKEYLKEESEYINPRGMSGADIARELGISRQAVSQALKRAMGKMYEAYKKEMKTSPFETAVSIAIGLEVDDDDFNKFFKLFPPATRKEIEEDSKHLIRK